jgi:hypothetical protein
LYGGSSWSAFMSARSSALLATRLRFRFKLFWAQQMFLLHPRSTPVSTRALQCYLTWVRCCIWRSTPATTHSCCNIIRGA